VIREAKWKSFTRLCRHRIGQKWTTLCAPAGARLESAWKLLAGPGQKRAAGTKPSAGIRNAAKMIKGALGIAKLSDAALNASFTEAVQRDCMWRLALSSGWGKL
jgi:hypothetical protein